MLINNSKYRKYAYYIVSINIPIRYCYLPTSSKHSSACLSPPTSCIQPMLHTHSTLINCIYAPSYTISPSPTSPSPPSPTSPSPHSQPHPLTYQPHPLAYQPHLLPLSPNSIAKCLFVPTIFGSRLGCWGSVHMSLVE